MRADQALHPRASARPAPNGTHLDARRREVPGHVHDVAADPARDRLEQLADVQPRLHPLALLRRAARARARAHRRLRYSSTIRAAVVSQSYRPTRSCPRRDVLARASGRRGRRAARIAVGQRVDVDRRHQDGGVAEHLGERAGVAGDDRHAALHRLERREAEALVDRRVREHRRAGEEVGAVAVGDEPGLHDAVARRDRVDRRLHAREVPSGRTREHEPEPGVGRRRRGRTRARAS